MTENPPVQIYIKRIKNWNVFEIKAGNKLKIVNFWNNGMIREYEKNADKNKDGENIRKLESFEVVLVHCNLVKSDYQHTSKVSFTFVPNKQFAQLINISPYSFL